MGIEFRAGVFAAVLAAVAQTAGAQQRQVFQAELQSLGEATGGNRFFATGQEAFQRLQEQLADPEQRAVLRAEQRISIEAGHPDLAAALGIDAATEHRFLDLLADQQLERQLEFLDRTRQAPAGMRMQIMQATAESQTRMIEGQRAVLGDEAMERYRDYMDTLGARLQVSQLDARLATSDKLQPVQKAKLIALIHEHDPLRAKLPPRLPRSYALEMGAVSSDKRGPQVFWPSHHFERLEDMLKTALEKDRQLFAATTGLLTPPQQKALEDMRGEYTTRMRLRLEEARSTAAASSALSAVREAQPADDERKALPGDIRIEVTVKVDGGKPTVVKHTGPNGQAVELEVDGIVVEVTPTLYEGNWLETQLAYYEQGPNGRRRIGNGSQGGMVSQNATGSPFGGGGSTIVTGSKKAYNVETGVTAAPMQ